MRLVEIENSLMNLNEAKREQIAHFDKKMKELQVSINHLERQKKLHLEGFDLKKIEEAERILQIKDAEYDSSCVRDAIADILRGTPHMKTHYFGSKNYQCFLLQRSDHPYVYGPTHGTIVFSIGLNWSYRNGLSQEQEEDCLYYLNLLLDPDKRAMIKFKPVKGNV